MTQVHVLTLDLHDDPALISEYEALHRPGAVWPEVLAAIRSAGIVDMRIFRRDTRLVMVMTVTDGFSFERKAAMDAADPVVQRWERLMERFQAAAGDGKWRGMTPIFELPD